MEEDDTMTSFEGHHLTPDQERSTMLPSPLPPAWSSNPGDDVRSVFESAGISLKTVLSGIKKGALKSSGAGSGNRALLYGPARGQPLGIAVRQSLENKVYLLPQSIVQQLPPGSPVSFPREDGFDITVASEIMAIFCLANDLEDLENRIGNITIGYTREKKPIFAKE